MTLAGCAAQDAHHHIPPEVEAAANADGADMQLFSQALSGEFPGSNYIQSPNYSNASRKKGAVKVIVVHTIQGSYNGCISWFKNPKAKVSAHYVVSKGGAVTQMVKEEDIGWHVGSQNGYTIGIEHEGYVSDSKWVTTAMLDKSAKLTCYLTKKWGLAINRTTIKGHVELPKQSHTDPGKYWPWDNYIARVKKHCGQGGGVVNPPTCGSCDDKNACTKDVCSNGKCTHPYNNGAVCWDGDPCTSGEKCSNGKCVGGKIIVQCNDNNSCTTDKCDSKTGKCAHSAKTGACNDGNPCTLGDSCTSGKCKWTSWKSCADGSVCTDDVCDQKTGACKSTYKAGASCKDNNPCTDDKCDPKTGKCAFTPNKATCSDGNACTKGDACNAGSCKAGAPLNCDDGNKCTTGEHCSGGKCVHGVTKTCGSAGSCATGVCDAATGLCNGTQVVNGKACDDGSPCTAADTCNNGQCAGVGVDCDDSNPCTNDTCGAGGCAHTPNTMFCSDDNPCTLGDKCAGGYCAGKPMDCSGAGQGCSAGVCLDGTCKGGGDSCDDGDPCTTDACGGGLCTHVAHDNLCSDGNACTAGDSCKDGFCSGAWVDCNDNDACTMDRCTDGKCVSVLRAECGHGASSGGTSSGGTSSGGTSSGGTSSGGTSSGGTSSGGTSSGGNSSGAGSSGGASSGGADAGGTGGTTRSDAVQGSRPDASGGANYNGVPASSGGCSASSSRAGTAGSANPANPANSGVLVFAALLLLGLIRRRSSSLL